MFGGFFLEPVVKKKKKVDIYFLWVVSRELKKQVWIPIFATFTHDLTVGRDDEH